MILLISFYQNLTKKQRKYFDYQPKLNGNLQQEKGKMMEHNIVVVTRLKMLLGIGKMQLLAEKKIPHTELIL